MNSLNVTTIKCPCCNAEYLPSEIFYPDEFLGTPKDIVKNANGGIEYFSGDSMNLEEEYVCDVCNTKFKVIADVMFNTSQDDLHSMDKEHTTTLFKNRVTLDENKEVEKLF